MATISVRASRRRVRSSLLPVLLALAVTGLPTSTVVALSASTDSPLGSGAEAPDLRANEVPLFVAQPAAPLTVVGGKAGGQPASDAKLRVLPPRSVPPSVATEVVELRGPSSRVIAQPGRSVYGRVLHGPPELSGR
jgi:hypothetical protein